MKTANKLSILTLVYIVMSSCAWYQGPEMMPDGDANLDASSLNESRH